MSLAAVAKHFVRRILEQQGFDVVARVARNGPQLSVLALAIDYWVATRGRGPILQIGANDGVLKDPVRDTIVRLGLPALLVEPLPDVFERLKENYAGQPQVQFANLGVSDEPGEAEIFRINPGASDLPRWVQGIASFDKKVLLKHAKAKGVDTARFVASIHSVRVPVLTMVQLLERYPDMRNPLALQIDTEGHDYHVLRAAIAADCLPPIINYEHKHLGYETQVKCRELLAARGYTFVSARSDTLAVALPHFIAP